MAENCPQCHYIPSDKKKKEEEECPQCFYEPNAEDKKAGEDSDCAQCFYESKPEKEPEECPQCFYDVAAIKKEEEGAAEPAKEAAKTEEDGCPQCFYGGAAAEKEPEECPQCFYEPNAEDKKAGEDSDCAQCFYESKPEKEPEECPQCFYDVAAIKKEEAEAEAAEKKAGVRVYTMPECGHCRMVMDFLKARGVPFEAISIPTSKEAQHFMETNGFVSAPVTVIGDVKIMGSEIAEIKKALGL
ncbi:MAG: glutaredoxin family protein [Synergistaceae bacterium]|nr:glutaredoxin family protein [Synergistaceae bacterium]